MKLSNARFFPTSLVSFQVQSDLSNFAWLFPTSSKLSNYRPSNLKLSNCLFQLHVSHLGSPPSSTYLYPVLLKLIKVFVIHAIFRTITLWSLKHLLKTINLLWKRFLVFGMKILQQNISKLESLSVCFPSWPRLTLHKIFKKMPRQI